MRDHILDFKCTYDNSAGVSAKVAEESGLTFPDAYLHGDTMALLSKTLKHADGAVFCELPFCHTVEAEAMGGIINLGNAQAGPRAKEYCCSSMEEVLALPAIDFSRGRIGQVLQACKLLTEEGEHVVLEVSGPFTILNVLIDPKHVYRCLRKNPELAEKIFRKLGDEVLRFIEEAKKCGVEFISYADASGGVNILGPQMSKQVVDFFTYEYVKKLEALADERTMILLCPKTTLALIGSGRAQWQDIELRQEQSLTYQQACIELLGKIRLSGMMCVKNVNYPIASGVFKAVELL